MAEIVARKKGMNRELVSLMEENIEEAKRIHKAGRITGYLDMDFHVLLARATENPMFVIVLKTLKLSFDILTPRIKRRAQISANRYHRRILEAIKKRDPVTAGEQMYQHLLIVRRSMINENLVL